MQTQKSGQGQQQGQIPNKNIEVRNEGNGTKPEIENPQPTRKVEEPITGNAMYADVKGHETEGKSERNNVESTDENRKDKTQVGNQDYQRSDAGFRADKTE